MIYIFSIISIEIKDNAGCCQSISLEPRFISWRKFNFEPDTLFINYMPNITTFAAGSNCFSGSLPSSICSATKLETLVISGLGSGRLCRNDIWKKTVFHKYITGYTSEFYTEGTLPQCLFTLDNLEVLYAGGNRILGELPQIISPKLKKISLQYNELSGTIPPLLAASSKLTHLDLSHNRFGGDLQQAFREVGAGDALDLALRVNNLSGDIPKSIQTLNNIDVLSGNVFDCSYSKDRVIDHALQFRSIQVIAIVLVVLVPNV